MNTTAFIGLDRAYRNYINGTFVDAATGLIDVTNPATGTVIARVPDSDAAEVDRAVTAARQAQGLGAVDSHRARRISAQDFRQDPRTPSCACRYHHQGTGKVRGLAQVEVDFTADYIDYMAEWARRIEGEVLTSDRLNETMILLRKPVGVVAGILPWNFPFFLIARKLAPALVTGNTIVIKPSEETPINAFIFAELVAETDLPKGVFNLVGGRGRTAAKRSPPIRVSISSRLPVR